MAQAPARSCLFPSIEMSLIKEAHAARSSPPMRRAAARVALLLASVTPLRAASLSCLNECSHHGECSDGVCVCEAAFTGNDCSLDSCGVGNTCSTHGSCHDFACKCDSGWTGFDCSQQRCPNDCFNRGDCVSGKCICAPGYFGDDCALETCANNCTGHGTCEDNSCQCFAGWEGNDCSSKTCPSGCAGHGTCLNGNCLCRHGWIGQTCELSSCANGCSGHGSCVNLKCACDDGWSGARCPTASPPHSHLHPSPLHLTLCTPTRSSSPYRRKAQLFPRYAALAYATAGFDCSLKTCPADCSGHGICQNGTCACENGFTGAPPSPKPKPKPKPEPEPEPEPKPKPSLAHFSEPCRPRRPA